MSEFTEIGELTIGGCVPTAVSAVAIADASLAVVLPQVEAQVVGLVELQANLIISPPSIEASIALALQLVASLQAAATLPGAALNLEAVAVALAELEATLGGLQAQLSAIAAINVTLGTPGVWAYAHTGTPNSFGPDAAAEIGGGLPDSLDPDLPTYAVVFIASDAGAISAMQAAFAAP